VEVCNHALPYHQEESERKRQQILSAVSNSAVLLSRSSLTDEVRVDFAHRLLRVHRTMSTGCVDSEWKDALIHKLCASYLRWESSLVAVTTFPLQRDVACTLYGLPEILRACRAHVSPTALDTMYCTSMPTACADRSPWWGLCTQGNSPRPRPRKRHVGSHTRHNTRRKHASHSHSLRAEESARSRALFGESIAKWTRPRGTPNDGDPRPSVVLAAVFAREGGAWDLTRCAVDGRVVCVDREARRFGVLKETVRGWLRGCHAIARDESPVELVLSGTCGAVITWPDQAEAVFRRPCSRTGRLAPLELKAACTSVGAGPTARTWVLDPRRHTFRVYTG